ncbi:MULTISPECIES: pRL2-8 [unclassified Streptomyces]|uniref:pRL2-8 n=1 Tax=unclassified Streptomyces TaxID=2593676 RepID=UPI00278C6BAD|nr:MULTISPECIES: pRL2-8 [unclassified Streptomyces]
MGLFGTSSPAAGSSTPKGECPQCWRHAHNPEVHRALGPRQDCPQCLDHMINGCPGLNRR